MNTSPFLTPHLTDLADQAERFLLMAYERQPTGRVLHNDSWALALAGHAREIALRRPGAGPDLVPLARTAALLYACRYWGAGTEKRDWEDVSQEFRQWTGPGYLNLNLALKSALPGGNGPLVSELADVLHDARLAQRLLAGTEGAELTWLEARYAVPAAPTTTAPDRLVALSRYLEELRQARFRSSDLRRQYQHTHSAVLLDLQRLVDKLAGRLAKTTSFAPAAAPLLVDNGIVDNGQAGLVPTELAGIEAGPTRQAAQTYFRTVFRNHINLLAMADQKAAIMISVNALLIGALVTFTSYRNWAETRPLILLPVAFFTVCGLVSLVYAALAARPAGREDKEENLAFFGFFSGLSLKEFTARTEARLQDPNALYGTLIGELHGLGRSLQRKHNLLRMAYTIFLVGLTVGAVVVAGIIVL